MPRLRSVLFAVIACLVGADYSHGRSAPRQGVARKPAAASQTGDAFLDAHRVAVAANPDDVDLTIQVVQSLEGQDPASGRPCFRLGDVVTLDLAFTSRARQPWQLDVRSYDRSGRLDLDRVVIDPANGATDPLYDYFNNGFTGFIGGGLGGVRPLSERPETLRLDVNEWWRFLRPGRFRLYVTSHRLQADRSTEAGSPRSNPSVTSNILEIEILAGGTPPEHLETAPARRLRFLETGAAALEMARRLRKGDTGAHHVDSEPYECRLGLIGSPDRKSVVEMMERLIDQEAGGAGQDFIETLAMLSVLLRYPPMRAGINDPPLPLGATDVARRLNAYRDAVARYTGRAARSVAPDDKRGRAAMLAAMAEMASVAPFQAGAASGASGDAVVLRTELPALFDVLPPETQYRLLAYRWRAIAGPAMLPALRRLLTDAPTARRPGLDTALGRFRELAPGEYRGIVIGEIETPTGRFRADALSLPGDDPFVGTPELDRLLVDRLAAPEATSGRAGATWAGRDTEFDANLLERYATAAVVEPVIALYRSHPEWSCSTRAAVVSYVLRARPEAGERLVRESLADRERTGCYWGLLDTLARRDGTPRLERLAVEYLADPAPEVAASAARALQYAGSRAGKDALWLQLEAWNAKWKGRARELESGPSGPGPHARDAALGAALRDALAQGTGWLLDDADTRRLEQLCVDEGCRAMVRQRRGRLPTSLDVLVMSGEATPWISLGGTTVPSVAALKARMALYPPGTAFRWIGSDSMSDDTEARWLADLRSAAASHGQTVVASR